MDLQELRVNLDEFIEKLSGIEKDKLLTQLSNVVNIYPFNEYEYIISNLLWKDALDLEEYELIRSTYISENMYLPIIEIAWPRPFWETWAQSHVMSLDHRLLKPNVVIDTTYKWQYDLVTHTEEKQYVTIEVKACRALDKALVDESYAVKALSYPSLKTFDMNFQQIKPDFCDVFVWVAVWRNTITYWVLNTNEVKDSKYYMGKQHAKSEWEWQLHVNNKNIAEFEKYKVEPNNIYNAIIGAYIRLGK